MSLDASQPWLLTAFSALFGLIIGSFLNVVVYRIPLMRAGEEQVNLSRPRSHCPDCGAPIRGWRLLPLISYLALRGRCQQCAARISPRYPAIEVLATALAVQTALSFAAPTQALAAMCCGWCLLALAAIDLRSGELPDALTLPLLWCGLLVNSNQLFCAPHLAIWGAATGYLALWSVYWIFKWATGREGMGYGDMKLCAAIGAWIGVAQIPNLLVIFSFSGLAYAAFYLAIKGGGRNTPIPVGPCLAAAGWILLSLGGLGSEMLGFEALLRD